MVVHSITDLNRLYAMYEQGDKSVYAVFSKERARDGYMRYPAVRWNRRRRAFLCPDCDAVIEMDISEDGIKGIDGLARLVQQQFELDPFTNTLFLFCGRRRDRIKGLYWEKDGFILLYKRLEQGAYQWPRSESEVKTLTPQQYRWLMEGLQIEQPKAHRPVTGLSTV